MKAQLFSAVVLAVFAAAAPFRQQKRYLEIITVTEEVVKTVWDVHTVWVPPPTSTPGAVSSQSSKAAQNPATSVPSPTSITTLSVLSTPPPPSPPPPPSTTSTSTVSSPSVVPSVSTPAPAPIKSSTTPPPPPPSPTPANPAPVIPSSQPAPVPVPAPVSSPAPAESSASSSTGGSFLGLPANTPCIDSACTDVTTVYSPSVGTGACGWLNADSDIVVAVPVQIMGALSNSNPMCGKTVQLQHAGKTVVAKVVDKCMGCKSPTALDLSPGACEAIGGVCDGVTQDVTWKWI